MRWSLGFRLGLSRRSKCLWLGLAWRLVPGSILLLHRRLRHGSRLLRGRCRGRWCGRRRGGRRRCGWRSGADRGSERTRLEPRLRSRLQARLARGIGFDFADRFFQRQPLAGDIGFRKRRIDRAQLGNQRRACPLIESPACFTGTLAKPLDGAGYERLIVGHGMSLRSAPFIFILIKLQTDSASRSCPRAPGW